jgi:hypothetical protein
MLALLGVALTSILFWAAFCHELRTACHGVTLSNGVEVLVSPEIYREVLRRYGTLDEPDDARRWDRAVLDVMRPVRPLEWRFLVETLEVARDEVTAGVGRPGGSIRVRVDRPADGPGAGRRWVRPARRSRT